MSARAARPHKAKGRRAPERRRLALVHVAKRQLGLTDEQYRDLLQGAAGVRSAGDLRHHYQWDAVFRAFDRAGWKRGQLNGQWSALYAAWMELHRAGAVRRGSLRALQAWLRQRYGAQDIYRRDQLSSAIEALKAWRKRVAATTARS